MSFQELKTKSYCVGGRHHSSTINIAGGITINKKTGKQVKLLTGRCSVCNRKKSMNSIDNVIVGGVSQTSLEI